MQKLCTSLLCILLGLNGPAFAQTAILPQASPTSQSPSPSQASPATRTPTALETNPVSGSQETPQPNTGVQAAKVSVNEPKKILAPEMLGMPLTFTSVPTGSNADALKAGLSIVNDRKAVARYFNGKMWRKRFVPFYLTLENTGRYPVEVSTGSILLLEERSPVPKKTVPMAQLAATKPVPAKGKAKKKRADLPPFVVPTPPGIAFNKSKHVQYGWKSNIGMLALTGITFGFAAPVTVPAMVMGNMYRGNNKHLAASFQDQSLARVTVEPGDKFSTWLFYRRDRKKQTLLPKKVVFADIYTPGKDEVSSFVIDLQPMATEQAAVRRKLEDSEVRDLQIFQGKISADSPDESATDKMKSLDSLTGTKSDQAKSEQKETK